MLNSLPLVALGAVAIVYAGAMAQADQHFDSLAAPSIVSFDSSSDLSVQDFVAALPQSVDDPLCGQKDQITATLSDDFAESVLSVVQGDAGQTHEIWTSDLMGTWTVLDVTDAATTCIVQSGYGWEKGMTARDILKPTPLSS